MHADEPAGGPLAGTNRIQAWRRLRTGRSGFTLTELLVVISIIAVLAGLLMSAVIGARGDALQTECASNLRQIGLALSIYLDQNGDVFPEAGNMPSLGLTTQPILPDVLEGGGLEQAFRCPADEEGYFQREGSSYEWSTMLNGRKRGAISRHGRIVKDEEIRVLWDYGCFHGSVDEAKARNVLFLDSRVQSF